MSNERCRFKFNPAEWETKHDARCNLSDELLEDGQWHCPHDTDGDSTFCIFHRNTEEKDSEAVAEALIELVNSDANQRGRARENRRFIGARLSALPVDNAVLGEGSNYPIDFRYSRVDDALDIEYATFSAPVFLDGSDIASISAHGSTFEKRVEAPDAIFHSFDFQSAAFEDRANFRNTRFGDGSLFNICFNERAVFRQATFDFPAHFDNGAFVSEAIFTRCRFESIAVFDDVEFHAASLFRNSELTADISFQNATFHGELQFVPASVESDDIKIRFQGSRINAGELTYRQEAPVIFVLREATLGPVDIGAPEGPPNLDNYWFLDTSFEGFDFADYTDTLIARNWLIHPLAEDIPSTDSIVVSHLPFLRRARQTLRLWRVRPLEDIDTSPGLLRATYLRAKNGAKEVGDNTASAEFFLHEMRYKRKAYFTGSNRSRLSMLRWILNWGYNLTAGYGERPFRTVVFSFVIILLFGWLYTLISAVSYREGVAFSVQAFVALVLGAPTSSGRLSIAAATEAFVGAFMIALFVFTLTRSVRR